MAQAPQFTNEQAALRRVVAHPNHRIKWTKHSLDQMRDRDVTYADVNRVLRMGRVTWIEQKRDELWHVEGRDIDGRSIRLVAAVEEEVLVIKVVTVVTPKG